MRIIRSVVASVALMASISAMAQSPGLTSLPPAPSIHLTLNSAQMGNGAGIPSQGGIPTLTRHQAEQMAIRNNPRISASRLLALAQHQVVREAHSADLPFAEEDTTAMDAQEGGRLSAGDLSASRMLTHAGSGLVLSQLITNFGRVHNLVLTQKLEQQAMQANAMATNQEIVLYTDQAFYNALTAEAILKVAKQTVATRTVTETQVRELTQNKLRSTLDLSIAEVNVSEAKLMEIDAEDNAASTMATLDAILGLDHSQTFRLIDNPATPGAPPLDSKTLVQEALHQRPDLQSLSYSTQSAKKFARAQWDQLLPSISVLGTVGATPVRPDQYYNSNWWGAIGVNLNIPIFNGFLYTSQAKEAEYHAKADAEYERNLRDRIVRDVHIAWLQTQAAYQKLGVTAQLVKEADMSLSLAQTRYQLGLSSIVELSQAQLQQTTAQIEFTNAHYEYRLALATLRYQIGQNP